MTDTVSNNLFNDAAEERRGRKIAQHRLVVQKWYNARRCADEWVRKTLQEHHDKIDVAIRNGRSLCTIRTEMTREQLRQMEWNNSYKTITASDTAEWNFGERETTLYFLMTKNNSDYKYDYDMIVPKRILNEAGLVYGGKSCPTFVNADIRRKWCFFPTKMVDVTIEIKLDPYNLEHAKKQ
jgi:hypothetical protein